MPRLANCMKVFDNPVPAIDPFKPLFANAPNKAEVVSKDTPNALDVGAASLNDSTNEPKFCAELTAAEAITSTTLPVSDASNPNDLTVDPANSAASAKPTSNDAAKSNIAGAAAPTSLAEKPNFANSV